MVIDTSSVTAFAQLLGGKNQSHRDAVMDLTDNQPEDIDDQFELKTRGQETVDSFFDMVIKVIRNEIHRAKHTTYLSIADAECEYMQSLKKEVSS